MKNSIQAVIERHMLSEISATKNSVSIDDLENILKSFQDTVSHISRDPIENIITRDDISIHGVINPTILRSVFEVELSVMFVSSQYGSLGRLVEYIEDMNISFSYSVLYGDWDIIIFIWSTKSGSKEFYDKISSDSQYSVERIEISNISYLHKGAINSELNTDINFTREYVDSVASGMVDNMDDLVDQNVVVATFLSYREYPIKPISAYVGISAAGGTSIVNCEKILEMLLSNKTCEKCLEHVLEVSNGKPFHFIIKVMADELSELDEITNHIGFMRFGNTKFQGSTFIAASDVVRPPRIHLEEISKLSEVPSFENIEQMAMRVLAQIGNDAINQFNLLPPTRQLIVLNSIFTVTGEIHREPKWDMERSDRFDGLVKQACMTMLRSDDQRELAGPAGEIATVVENYLKRALRQIVDFVYNSDYARSQKELKLPTKDYRRLTLGKLHSAFVEMSTHVDFEVIRRSLTPSFLQSLDGFSDNRNIWTHGSMEEDDVSADERITSFTELFVDGLKISRVIGGQIQPLVSSKPQSEDLLSSNEEKTLSRQKRNGVFLSHSTKDKDIAEKIAKAVQAFGINIWYSEWALSPGDSLVGKVDEALGANDCLVVLVSENSLESEWVSRELNSTVMNGLSGKKVAIIPVLIDGSNLPEILKDILYIDMSGDYTEGLLKLLEYLRKRYKEK